MKQNYHPLVLVLGVLVLASLACQALASTQPAATQAPQQGETQQPSPSQSSSQSAIEPATLNSKGPGIVCMGSTTGLSCLNEKGWQAYTDENGLPNNYLDAGTVCPDGQFAIALIDRVVLFDGKAFKELPTTTDYSAPEGIACDAKGDVWYQLKDDEYPGVKEYARAEGLRRIAPSEFAPISPLASFSTFSAGVPFAK